MSVSLDTPVIQQLQLEGRFAFEHPSYKTVVVVVVDLPQLPPNCLSHTPLLVFCFPSQPPHFQLSVSVYQLCFFFALYFVPHSRAGVGYSRIYLEHNRHYQIRLLVSLNKSITVLSLRYTYCIQLSHLTRSDPHKSRCV